MKQKLAIQLINENPIATEITKAWFLKNMKDSMEKDNAPEEFKQHMLQKGIPDETLANLIDDRPRMFFDVFDENQIYVEIEVLKDVENKKAMFRFCINKFERGVPKETRTETEREAVQKVFELLQ